MSDRVSWLLKDGLRELLGGKGLIFPRLVLVSDTDSHNTSVILQLPDYTNLILATKHGIFIVPTSTLELETETYYVRVVSIGEGYTISDWRMTTALTAVSKVMDTGFITKTIPELIARAKSIKLLGIA